MGGYFLKRFDWNTFKMQQNPYQKGWPCALAPSADRLLRTLTCWIRILHLTAILEVGHVFLDHSLIHSQVCARLANHVSTFFYRSMRCCSYCTSFAHVSFHCLFIIVANTTCPRLHCSSHCSQLIGYLCTRGRTFVQIFLILSLNTVGPITFFIQPLLSYPPFKTLQFVGKSDDAQ